MESVGLRVFEDLAMRRLRLKLNFTIKLKAYVGRFTDCTPILQQLHHNLRGSILPYCFPVTAPLYKMM